LTVSPTAPSPCSPAATRYSSRSGSRSKSAIDEASASNRLTVASTMDCRSFCSTGPCRPRATTDRRATALRAASAAVRFASDGLGARVVLVTLYVVIVTKYPAGDSARLWPAIGIAFLAAIAAGLLNGFLVGRMRLNPIVATLGTNALLFGAVLWYSAGIPTTTTARLARVGGGLWLGIPAPVYFAVAVTALVAAVVKLTPPGRRFEGVGANETAARTAGLRVKRHQTAAYLWAQILYCLAAIMHAGIVNQPTAYEGNNYLLPTVAAVVLGGTSLLGGRGNLAATAVAALFLSQLDQFVLALGVTYATRSLVQAGALAVGVALYTIDWRGLARRVVAHRPRAVAPT